jgi:hypothetical protein
VAGLYDNPVLQSVPGEVTLRRYALLAALEGMNRTERQKLPTRKRRVLRAKPAIRGHRLS